MGSMEQGITMNQALKEIFTRNVKVDGFDFGFDVVKRSTGESKSLTKSSCGANGPGGGGFQPGNSCASGGSDVTGVNGKILDWAKERFGDDEKARNFTEWFGDSKVVDEDGNPLEVFHGTAGDFNEFRTGKEGLGSHFGTKQSAQDAFTSTGSGDGNHKIINVVLSIENPIELPDLGFWEPDDLVGAIRTIDSKVNIKESSFQGDPFFRVSDIVDSLKQAGYDGVKYENKYEDKGSTSWIAFDPTQIKSSIGNEGTFDPNDPDIRKSILGLSTLHDSELVEGVETKAVEPPTSPSCVMFDLPERLANKVKAMSLMIADEDLFDMGSYTKSCGAGGEGGTGFQQGNTCASGGGKVGKVDDRYGLPLNADGTVTLFHGTTEEGKRAIESDGGLRGKENGVFLTTTDEDLGYGTIRVALDVDPSIIEIDDEFSDGRMDFRVPVRPNELVEMKLGGGGGAGSVSELSDSLKDSLGLKTLRLKESDNSVELDMIRVDSDSQGEGAGSKAMDAIKEYAASKDKPVILTMEADDGRKDDLERFYERNGFERPTSKDYELSMHTHIWYPNEEG